MIKEGLITPDKAVLILMRNDKGDDSSIEWNYIFKFEDTLFKEEILVFMHEEVVDELKRLLQLGDQKRDEITEKK